MNKIRGKKPDYSLRGVSWHALLLSETTSLQREKYGGIVDLKVCVFVGPVCC